MKHTTIHTTATRELFSTLAKLNTGNEFSKFFHDLCTREEIEEMAGRWQAVRLVDKNMPYRTIAKKTGLSTATVTRVAQWLHHGNNGYRLAIRRIKRT